jgi:hypothetical protein
MIRLRHQQPSLWHRGLAEDIEGLWEPWMRLVDELLEDEQLLDTVYEAQGERHPQSRVRGRMQTPAEVVLRLTGPREPLILRTPQAVLRAFRVQTGLVCTQCLFRSSDSRSRPNLKERGLILQCDLQAEKSTRKFREFSNPTSSLSSRWKSRPPRVRSTSACSPSPCDRH